ncbi:hypothetical protein PG994_009016 [Apiospora phragmitis]|uniref:DUF1688-domain-containing protein n=1 Tax=Apiospora phragmitis TaxID=2905665 RepID=A0ABR1UI36_9PEZI
MHTSEDQNISYLLSLQAVRDRSRLVLKAAGEGALDNFDYHYERMPEVADFVLGVISTKARIWPYRFAEIPPHGRWQHFDVGGVDRITPLLKKWESEGCDATERTRRLIDLFFVSVLLDAGAGDVWNFKEPTTGKTHGRSEGIAVASPLHVHGWRFQCWSNRTPRGRLRSLLSDLFREPYDRSFFSGQTPQQRGVLATLFAQYIRSNGPTRQPCLSSKEPQVLDYEVFWSALQNVLIPSWPKDRTHVRGKPIGDAWPLQVLADRNQGDKEIGAIQPFHKLTQWLGIPLPYHSFGCSASGSSTGSWYRNGGLFVDLGVLQLKPAVLEQGRKASGQDLPSYSATGDVIVEWRAMTVALLDELYKLISAHFAEKGVQFSMAQMLEAGTWKGGRELAAKHRPETRSSPILMDGDGTLF